MDSEATYAFIHRTLRFRRVLVTLAAIFPALIVILIAWPAVTWTEVLAGLIAGGAVTFLAELMIAVVQVIADTLLPR